MHFAGVTLVMNLHAAHPPRRPKSNTCRNICSVGWPSLWLRRTSDIRLASTSDLHNGSSRVRIFSHSCTYLM